MFYQIAISGRGRLCSYEYYKKYYKLRNKGASIENPAGLGLLSLALFSAVKTKMRAKTPTDPFQWVQNPNRDKIGSLDPDIATGFRHNCGAGSSAIRVATEKQLEEKLALEITAQVAAGLAAVHEQKLVHPDIKSTNISTLRYRSKNSKTSRGRLPFYLRYFSRKTPVAVFT